MTCTLINDNSIIWLLLDKIGSPSPWVAGKNYQIGDRIVPTAPTVSQANMMFQCVGFLAKTPGTAPAWPTNPVAGDPVISGGVEYAAQPAASPPMPLKDNQYFLITRNITVS